MDLLILGVTVVIMVMIMLLGITIYGQLLHKVGPNQALIIFGADGVKVITSGAHFVIPLYQRAQYLDQLSGEELLKDPEAIATQMVKTTLADLNRMGLEMISFTLKRDASSPAPD